MGGAEQWLEQMKRWAVAGVSTELQTLIHGYLIEYKVSKNLVLRIRTVHVQCSITIIGRMTGQGSRSSRRISRVVATAAVWRRHSTPCCSCRLPGPRSAMTSPRAPPSATRCGASPSRRPSPRLPFPNRAFSSTTATSPRALSSAPPWACPGPTRCSTTRWWRRTRRGTGAR